MIVVTDASPLMNLAIIGQLDLLSALYNKVIVPQAVYDEVVNTGQDMPGSHQIRALQWLEIKQVQNDSLVTALHLQLDKGESEAIALALEIRADLLLIDERKARTVAAQFNLRFTGLLGVLIEAKEKGLIAAVQPLMDRLIDEAGFWISEPLYQHILGVADELA